MNSEERDQWLGGMLSFGLFVVGAPAAVVIGVAADKGVRRVGLLTLILVIGSVGCILSALAQSGEKASLPPFTLPTYKAPPRFLWRGHSRA